MKRENTKNWTFSYFLIVLLATSTLFMACGGNDNNDDDTDPTETDYTDLLTNQIDGVIIPTVENYQSKMASFVAAVDGFEASPSETSFTAVRTAYQEAYLAYQAVALHNYYATLNSGLVTNTNLYPIDTDLLSSLIDSETYNFSTTAQQRANGFPVIDYMLYGAEDAVTYLSEDKNLAFLSALVSDMKEVADSLVETWTGNLRENFIGNGGTGLGSAIYVQLNNIMVYYEDHIRENKVGIPIGLLGPNDSPIDADGTKIEAYYQSIYGDSEDFTFSLLKAAIEEIEDFYLGGNGQGYDDLLLAQDHDSIDADIKAQFVSIYNLIDSRSSISGDDSLYEAVQHIVTLFKSDVFSVLNVQDADGANDGD